MAGNPDRAAREMVEMQLKPQGIRDKAVLEAMARVPRHRFLPDRSVEDAYSDHALPTAEGQTISQPLMVARMTELLEVRPGVKVLEIGTGSGYQTAVLAALGAQVVTLERFESLAQRARQMFEELDVQPRPQVVVGDGTLGWPGEAPYDRSLVTAGAPAMPSAYRDQLADPGRIVIPLGNRQQQMRTLVTLRSGAWDQVEDLACQFVPLVGEEGWVYGD